MAGLIGQLDLKKVICDTSVLLHISLLGIISNRCQPCFPDGDPVSQICGEDAEESHGSKAKGKDQVVYSCILFCLYDFWITLRRSKRDMLHSQMAERFC